MISLSGAVALIMQLVIAGLVFWLLMWLIDYVSPPEPFMKIAKVILAILAVAVLIGLLISFGGGGPIFRQ